MLLFFFVVFLYLVDNVSISVFPVCQNTRSVVNVEQNRKSDGN